MYENRLTDQEKETNVVESSVSHQSILQVLLLPSMYSPCSSLFSLSLCAMTDILFILIDLNGSVRISNWSENAGVGDVEAFQSAQEIRNLCGMTKMTEI